MPVLFFLSSSITLSVLPAVSPLLPPLPPPTPSHFPPFSSPPLPFVPDRVALHSLLPPFSPYHFPVIWLLSQSRMSMVLGNCVLGFTQCGWHKLIRVIRCSLTVVLPLKWRLSFLSLLLPYHLTF